MMFLMFEISKGAKNHGKKFPNLSQASFDRNIHFLECRRLSSLGYQLDGTTWSCSWSIPWKIATDFADWLISNIEDYQGSLIKAWFFNTSFYCILSYVNESAGWIPGYLRALKVNEILTDE